MKTFTCDITNYTKLESLAKDVVSVIIPELVITLNGELGSGKTTFVREILKHLGETGSIKSPTFTFVEPYLIKGLNILHFDLYRFDVDRDWFSLGFDEYFEGNNICFIEWASRALEYIPRIDWEITIDYNNEKRMLSITPKSDKGLKCLSPLIKPAAS